MVERYVFDHVYVVDPFHLICQILVHFHFYHWQCKEGEWSRWMCGVFAVFGGLSAALLR